MVGLNSNWGVFFYWWLVFYLYTSFDTFLGVMLVVLLPNEQAANVMGIGVSMIWNIASGFMIPYGQMPAAWQWLYWISPPGWALQGVLATQYYCDGSSCPTMSVFDASTGDTTYKYVWDYTSSTFGLHYDRRWIAVGVLAFCVVATRVLTLLGLRFVCHLKR
eukprot:RCo006649